ncbi:MAG: hypothetical protein WA996_20420, partial [Candidatus Promineifilaceae bacterium]
MMMQRRGGREAHGPMGAMGDDKATDFKGTMVELSHYLAEYKLKIILVIIFAVVSTVFAIIGPRVLGNATTALFDGAVAELSGTGSIDFEYIGSILLTMLGLYILSALFAYLMGWI